MQLVVIGKDILSILTSSVKLFILIVLKGYLVLNLGQRKENYVLDL